MAKVKISEFSATAANNTDIDGININEGCPPSSINDAIRELMAQLKDFQTGAVGDSFNGPIGTSTASTGAFTTLSATGAITSTLATGTAPLVIASTTKVANLNVDLLDGADWAAPAALGSTTPAAVSATTLAASGSVTLSGGTANGVAYLNGSKVVTSGSALTFNGTRFSTYVTSNSNQNIARFGVQNTANTDDAFLDIYADAANNLVTLDSTGNNAGLLAFNLGGSEQMRLTSTGLGIGTSSPATKLQVSANEPKIRLTSTAGSGKSWDISSGGNTTVTLGQFCIYDSTTDSQRFNIASGSGSMLLDGSGNLGLGVTPSAWGATAFQVLRAALWGVSNSAYLSANTRFDGSSRYYIATDSATEYRQTAGQHSWLTAPSGTAGNAITFTQAMTLTADGALAIGTTSPTAKLHVSNGGAAGLEFSPISGYLGGGYIQGYNRSTSAFIPVEVIAESFGVVLGSSRALTVDSSGNLLVGTTSAFSSGKVCIQVANGSTQNGITIQDNASSGFKYIAFSNGSGSTIGSISRVGTTSAVVYNTTSDYRLKTVTGSVTGQGARIDALKPIDYQWKESGQNARGFLAHEFETVYPNSVTGAKDAVDADGNPVYQAMQASTAEVIADLVAEIQSLRVRVAQLESN